MTVGGAARIAARGRPAQAAAACGLPQPRRRTFGEHPAKRQVINAAASVLVFQISQRGLARISLTSSTL